MKKNVIIIWGGDSLERDISKVSAQFIYDQIDDGSFDLYLFELTRDFKFLKDNKEFSLTKDGFVSSVTTITSDYIIPYFHGYPGESGDFQSLLDFYGFKYLGSNSETSKFCFNKTVTKLMAEHIGIKTTPFISATHLNELSSIESFFDTHKSIFIKASNQGSSVGCYKVDNKEDIRDSFEKALQVSSYVTIEKALSPRELEVSSFSFNGKIHITDPSEIVCTDEFYTYDSKYNSKSNTTTQIIANIDSHTLKNIKQISKKLFIFFKIKDLARIDFFLDGAELYLNEINTNPGLTHISMFPRMMENYGIAFKDFIKEKIND
ncbi:MAG: D-alanine--D-alanine ligase [Bacteriovoracaceae bacterium]|nr:D-alanine--D-alanine ligase [Bacteriovoracaceae bacterium]